MATLYFKQLLVDRDVGRGDRAGTQMQNFVYLIGDRDSGECLVVDPAWDIDGIVARAAADDMRITGALVTHYHPDHIGGSMFGLTVPGLAELAAKSPCPVHVHKLEADGVVFMSSLSKSDLVLHEGNDVVRVGDVEVELLHTPGHTPGSQCFRLKSALVSGDTLFLRGCGRTDLPGGNAEDLRRTISQRLSTLPGDLVLYPGHAYGGESEALASVKQHNPVFQGLAKGSPS